MSLTVNDPKTIVIAALAIVLLWFAGGLLFNLRRGNAVLRWLQGGLPLLGEKTTFRWLGSSVAQLDLTRPRPPFRTASIMIVLAPRDVPWMWLLAAARGRRDILIFRADLAGEPAPDLELVDPRSWTGRTAVAELAGRGWVRRAYAGYSLYAPEEAIEQALQVLPGLESILSPASASVVRLQLRGDRERMEVHLPLPSPSGDARAYVKALRSLANQALSRRRAGAEPRPSDGSS